jgi:uncharacterized protein (TIGR02246 family)
MTRLLLLFAALPMLAASPESDIRKVLDDQAAAWNRGDIAAYMAGYDDSETTTFIGKNIVKGHAQVLENYKKRYPTRDNMGTLKFSGLEIRPLGPDYAAVIGRFHLDRSAAAGGESSGIFSLTFHKIKGEWKIILDHTS